MSVARAVVVAGLICGSVYGGGSALDLPIDQGALSKGEKIAAYGIRNLLSISMLYDSMTDGDGGLIVDFSHVARLLDGSKIDPANIYGSLYAGPYPFEASETSFSYKRFRTRAGIHNGRGRVELATLFKAKKNSEGWDNRGKVIVRFDLYLEQEGTDRKLGVYDLPAAVVRDGNRFSRRPWLVEGPLVNRISSDSPEKMVISFKTDRAVPTEVVLGDGRRFESAASKLHEVMLDGLKGGGEIEYRVRVGEFETKTYRARTAPVSKEQPLVVAYCGDSREGVGGGMNTYMGVNFDTIERHAALALEKGADLFLMGGDMINGYTSSPLDFEMQFFAWKQAMSGFWHERPVYPVMGNHEALLRSYNMEKSGRCNMDAWPYAADSAEALFASSFANPLNGPKVSDPRRPSYRESVFSFRHGCLKVIAFNNNYWYANRASRFGGCPEGYIMDDQMEWIEAELREASANPEVSCVLLYAQEPVFPCGGHIGDAMWYNGNNQIRAHTFRDGKLVPARDGIVDVRNRFVSAVADCPKVAAVLCSDEHAYYRVLIDRTVPIGDPKKDDKNRDGRIDWKHKERASALASLKHGTWYITCGGGGAPYYAEQVTPWTKYWRSGASKRDGFMYSSQENVVMFGIEHGRVGLSVYNRYGELIDRIDDLMHKQ